LQKPSGNTFSYKPIKSIYLEVIKVKYQVKLYNAILPYQVAPLFGVKKDQISVALAVVVLTGVELFGHLTAGGQIIDLPAVPSFARIRVNDAAPEVTPVVNVNVQFPVRVAVNTFPFARLIVAAVPVLPSAETPSV